MKNNSEKFSWVHTHKELVKYLSQKKDFQLELIQLLKKAGSTVFNDKGENGVIELTELDPFTFFCYIYKFGSAKRLKVLQKIAENLNLSIPLGEAGLPSANAQKVWLFPYKISRKNNEINRLWDFFFSVLNNSVTDEQFQNILQIGNVGKTKLTEALFYVNPEKYFPVNSPSKPYLKEEFGIESNFDSYSDYLKILEQIKAKSEKPFYQISNEAFEWNNQRKKIEQPKEENKIKYWLYAPGENANKWDEFYKSGIMALGWDELGDLKNYQNQEEVAAKLREIEDSDGSKVNNAKANFQFPNDINIGDIIIVKKGRKKLLGYGEVISDYYFDDERTEYKSCRKVDWKKKGNWKTDHSLVVKTLTDVSDYPSDHSDYNQYYERLFMLMDEKFESNQNSKMTFHLNSILYGPPGTGKTYNTVLRAAQIIEARSINNYAEALEIFNEHLGDRVEFVTFHQNYSYEDFIEGLRPDVDSGANLSFERKDGVFKRIADKALKNIQVSSKPISARRPFEKVFLELINPLVEGDKEEIEIPMKKVSFYITGVTDKSIEFRKNEGDSSHSLSIATLRKMYDKGENDLIIGGLQPYYNPLLKVVLEKGKTNVEPVQKQNYVIIIDEINRANISRVFGELITLIEPDKRSHGAIPLKCTLPSGEEFIVPSNLYIIGTMNTADKSIALLDIALRRRFEFEPMYPLYEIENTTIHDADILKKINEQIIKGKGHDFQIGHAYFMGDDYKLTDCMNKKVIPLLLEYYMNDTKEVKKILDAAGFDVDDISYPMKIRGTK